MLYWSLSRHLRDFYDFKFSSRSDWLQDVNINVSKTLIDLELLHSIHHLQKDLFSSVELRSGIEFNLSHLQWTTDSRSHLIRPWTYAHTHGQTFIDFYRKKDWGIVIIFCLIITYSVLFYFKMINFFIQIYKSSKLSKNKCFLNQIISQRTHSRGEAIWKSLCARSGEYSGWGRTDQSKANIFFSGILRKCRL